MNRILLSDVPRVHFYEGGEQSPEDVTFPSCLATCVRYLGEEYPWTVRQDENGRTWRENYAYVYLLAHSGMAFGLRWEPGWDMANADFMLVADPSEVIRRAFAAAGYSYEIVHKTGPADEPLYRQKVKEALQDGRPALAFGVVGPPECCLVTGYDQDGDVLMGWNFFQGLPPWNDGLAFEPTGQFRKPDWFKDTWSLIVLGEPVGRPELHQLNRDTLRFALEVARTPRLFGHHNGHAAYTAWAEHITDEAFFAGQPEATLRERHEVHNNVVGALAEARWYGARWLRSIAPDEPAMAEHLLAAAALFEQEHDLMWKVWGAVGGNGHPDAWQAFAGADVRRQIAAFIREAQAHDVDAIAHLEQAATS